MKVIESEAIYLPQEGGVEGMYKQIERCARTCYKSEDKITEGSAKDFVDRMIKSHHLAMLEQGTVYLVRENNRKGVQDWVSFYSNNPYSVVSPILSGVSGKVKFYCITTNMRVLVENNRLSDLKYAEGSSSYHAKRYTFKFTTDRGVMAELTRHRVFSFAVESTRQWRH